MRRCLTKQRAAAFGFPIKTDPEYEDNLKYFLEFGVRPGDGCDYLVVVQEVGGCWAALVGAGGCWRAVGGCWRAVGGCWPSGWFVHGYMLAGGLWVPASGRSVSGCMPVSGCKPGQHLLLGAAERRVLPARLPTRPQGKGVLASHLPEMPSNVHTVFHANECFDWGTFGWVGAAAGSGTPGRSLSRRAALQLC